MPLGESISELEASWKLAEGELTLEPIGPVDEPPPVITESGVLVLKPADGGGVTVDEL